MNFSMQREGQNVRKNIPLQKWVHIGYVLNNRSIDIYINGKLQRTCVLKGLPIPLNPKDKLRITVSGGFYGKVGRTQYFARSLRPEEIASLYYRGPTGASQYRVRFFQDGRIVEASRSDNDSDNTISDQNTT